MQAPKLSRISKTAFLLASALLINPSAHAYTWVAENFNLPATDLLRWQFVEVNGDLPTYTGFNTDQLQQQTSTQFTGASYGDPNQTDGNWPRVEARKYGIVTLDKTKRYRFWVKQTSTQTGKGGGCFFQLKSSFKGTFVNQYGVTKIFDQQTVNGGVGIPENGLILMCIGNANTLSFENKITGVRTNISTPNWLGNWHYIELEIKLSHGTDGYIRFYVDGAMKAEYFGRTSRYQAGTTYFPATPYNMKVIATKDDIGVCTLTGHYGMQADTYWWNSTIIKDMATTSVP